MTRTRIIIIVVIVAFAAVLVFGRMCSKGDANAEIKLMVEQMVQAAEQKNTQEFMKHFSRDYKDSSGNNLFIISQYVKRAIESVDELDVETSDLDIVATGDSAFFSVKVITRSRSRGRISHPFGSEENPEIPRVSLKRQGGEWKIVKVEGVSGPRYFDEF